LHYRAGDDSRIIGAVDGDGYQLLGAVDRSHREAVGQRVADIESLHGRIAELCGILGDEVDQAAR